MVIKLKFETKGNIVYGLSFHPKDPWILSSFHSGVIELWDYRKGTLIHRFAKHKGPVRGVHFHSSQPLFVSGGDDRRIRVWNNETHRRLFTLRGHTNFVRTVQFHLENPWIVSASDDHTIRIWNWELQTCISVLSGHDHCVMCASFHPKEDLVVSASLDQTVRVWDIGGVDDRVKYVLKGHSAGVNWASFHPTLPLIVSGANDCLVKLWHMNVTEASEVATLQGHMNHVSSVMFNARQDIIVSNDNVIRVWDATKRSEIGTLSRGDDRFRILAVHPEMHLLAAGHENGMILFKLESERPAFALNGNSLFYAKDRFLQYYEYSTQNDSQVIRIRSLNKRPSSLSYSPTENAVLICSDLDDGSYELFIIPKDSVGRSETVQDAKRGTGGSAVFIAPTQFAVLEKSTNQVLVKNIKNKVVKKSSLPIPTDAIFCAGTGNLLCSSKDKVFIFDLQQRVVLGELQTPYVRYVVWANDMESVALLSKHAITIASKKFVLQCTLEETVHVKSGAWDDNGVFIYTTLTDIKYWRPNGDKGIIQTLDVPVYITKVSGNTIFCLDRDGENRAITINNLSATSKPHIDKKKKGKGKAKQGGNSSSASSSSSSKLKKKRKGEAVEGRASAKKKKIDEDNSRERDNEVDDDALQISVSAGAVNHDKTNVWWDLENVPVPSDFPADQVYDLIKKNLREKGFLGRVKVTATVGYLDSFVPDGLTKNVKIDFVKKFNRPQFSKSDQTADGGIVQSISMWLRKGKPRQNVMMISGDNGFTDAVEKVKAAGHTSMVVLRKIEGQMNFSAEIRQAVEICWDDWRSFLGLADKKVAKQMKAIAKAKEKKKKDMKKKRKENYEKKKKKREKKRGELGSAASGGA